ncbi:hypothetical protein [Oricola sp.]|uniref:hypothetical protein n=1 Tax=Oricola sp. TaxID=1979950 RepID=UPI0025E838FD|nr:hypothetical protein [Oricola sp.]MCI5073840.1 hypothetical protein [Oricola sp.]
MEPIVAVMLVLGCDHSMMVCRQAPEPIVQYASVESCEEEMGIRVRMIDDYPMAVVECIKMPELASGQNVVVDWRFDATGGLIAEARVRDTGQMTADASTVTAQAGGV